MDFYKRLQYVASVKKKYQADVVADLKKDRPTVSKWWNGGVVPGPKNMRMLADYFGCNVAWLTTGKGEPFPDPTLTAVDSWLSQEERGMSELSEHELAIATERIAHKAKEHFGLMEKKEVDYGVDKKLDERSINELLTDTQVVLESETVYRQALASNIRAFKQAVINEDKMKNTDEKVDQLVEQVKALTAVVLQGQNPAVNDEKKRAGNDH